MKFAGLSLCALAIGSTVVAFPQPAVEAELSHRDVAAALDDRQFDVGTNAEELWKRKGGGGSGGRGGGGSSSGGRTSTGSGVAPQYGGGSSYGGGGSVPYQTGQRSNGGISPVFLGAGLGAAAFFPGLWLYSVYAYPYGRPWSYHNRTSNRNETKPVQCLCEEQLECGCDENNSTTFQNDILGDGSYAGLNKTLVTVANVSGVDTILLNGTLPNGTTAAGGTDDPNAAGSLRQSMMESSGYWLMTAIVGCTVLYV